MKNKLVDLNNHLFEQLERLNDPDISEEELDLELKRADGMAKISDQILKNADINLKAIKTLDDHGVVIKQDQVVGLLGMRDA